MRIAVIGAGPSGSFAAEQLAKKGHDVHLYEEHPTVGIPWHCTGIVTKALWDLIPKKDDLIINKLTKVRVHAPNKTFIDIPVEEYVIDRAKLDQYLAQRAVDAGVQLHTNSKFTGITDNSIRIKQDNEIKTLDVHAIIGADGPASSVARATNIKNKNEFYFSVQATAKGHFLDDTFEVWFGNQYPGFFAWLVPESKTIARIGVAAKTDPTKHFNAFVHKHATEIIGHQGGPIPLYNATFNRETTFNNMKTMLVGDAGGFVKATTGGGIITGMISGKHAADALHHNKQYTQLLAPLQKELKIHKRLRDILNKFSDEDYNILVQLMQNKKLKKILHDYPREYPSRFLFKLIWAQPRLLRFLKYSL